MRLMLILILLLPFSATSFYTEEQLKDEALEAQAKQIFANVRCVVCEGQSIGDSDAFVAKDLRKLIREEVKQGKSAEEIESYLVSRYGDMILLAPPFIPTTYLLWFLPLILLFLGVLIIFSFLRFSKVRK